MRLMLEIEELEDVVEELQEKLRASSGASGAPDRDATQRRLGELLGRLEEKRIELTRVSNACRRPHSNV
jgi:hypothetical protein